MAHKKKAEEAGVMKDDPVIGEPEAAEAASAGENAKTANEPVVDLEKLRAEVAEIVRQRDENHARFMQVSADFDNYKKRNANARVEAKAEATRDVILRILPVQDNLERALEAAATGEGEGLRAGVEMVAKQLVNALAALDVVPIESPSGTPFDPEVHNAVVTVPADAQHPDQTVFDTMQKGYTLGGKVIRYAMVRVAKEE